MVRSRGYEHRNVPRLALYMAVGPFLTTTIVVFGHCEAPEALKLLIAVGAPIASILIWSLVIIWRADFELFAFQSISILLALPVVGPLGALLWLLFSFGQVELLGLGSSKTEHWRRLAVALLGLLICGSIIASVHFGLL